MKKGAIYEMVMNFFYMLSFIKQLFNPESRSQQIIIIIYWVLWFVILSMLVYTKIKNRLDLVKPMALILLMNDVLPLLDFDGKRFRLS